MGTIEDRQLQITEQLARLEGKLSAYADKTHNYSEMILTRFTTLETRIEKLEHKIIGNGEEGMILRLDRLEQTDIRRNKLTWIAVTSSVSAFAAIVIKWITTGAQ